jgi:YjbE family integral membrane protein
LSEPQFWVALLQIIGVNIILSGDNAVVIALACRSLPPRQQRLGIALGAGAAVVLRILFTLVIVTLMAIPYLKIVGALLLFWIGYKLMVPDDEHGEVEAGSNLWQAVWIVLVADAVMSLDNVIAVAAAAKGNVVLLILGLLISIPLVVYGATLMIKLINRYPVIIVVGAALIGYIGGEILVTDPVWERWIDERAGWLHYASPILGGLFVVLLGQGAKVPAPATAGEAVGASLGVFGARLLLTVIGRVLITRAPLIVTSIAGVLGYAGGNWALGEQDASVVEESTQAMLHTLGPLATAALAVAIVELVARWRQVQDERSKPIRTHQAK